MSKFKYANGYNKEKVMAKIREGNNGQRSMDLDQYGRGQCAYLSEKGNKCFIGCFIPDGHPAQKRMMAVTGVLSTHPDLRAMMPLEGLYALTQFQNLHDGYGLNFTDPLHQATEKWLEENCE